MVARGVAAARLLLCVSLGALALHPGPALAEPPTQPLDDISEQVEATRDKEADPDKDSLLIVPIPQSSPTLGTGLTLGAGYFYNPNHCLLYTSPSPRDS